VKAGLLILLLALPAAVPGQDRSVLPLPAPGNVTLPLDEYNRLVELAHRPAKKPDAPPLSYALQCAELKLEVTGDSVSGAIQLEGEVFHKGVTKVPLLTGVTIFDAQQKGAELPLQQEGGTQIAVLPGPAAFALTLSAGLPLSIEAGRASLRLPVPAAGTVRLVLVIPGDHTNVNLNPGIITARASSNGRTTIEATLVPGQPATIWWATRESAAPAVPREVRFLSDVKTLVSVTETDLAIAALAGITVVQGEPAQFEIAIPGGYEVTGATGASLVSSEVQSGVLTLKVGGGARSHQFLISMVKPIDAAKVDVPFLSFKGAQRETGEILVEAAGAVELAATEGGGLKRMDLREISPYLRSLAHDPLQAAFRYHRQPTETPTLALAWTRFPDSRVLAAVAQQAVITTLVTSEGRSLTEVKLFVRNQAQPFLKVALPPGTGILSAEVAGEKVKPVEGPDGNRVPLLRPGFRPADVYPVSFVFLHSGAPFAKKGDSQLSLPKMDVPIGRLEWEVFLPDEYKVRDFGGDALPAALLQPGVLEASDLEGLPQGQLGGVVKDPSGATVPGTSITVLHRASGLKKTVNTDIEGRWSAYGVPAGPVSITAEQRGFQMQVLEIDFDPNGRTRYDITLRLGATDQMVTVTAEAPSLNTQTSASTTGPRGGKQKNEPAPAAPAPTNILNLQQRVAGVIPVRVDVPRAGRSYRFIRPLVLDEETRVTFSYTSSKKR
jgi:hypothetical protein